jgi:hypothetical protein
MSAEEIEKWTDAPPQVRARLVDHLKRGDILEALKVLMQFHNVPYPEFCNEKLEYDPVQLDAFVIVRDSIFRLQKAVDYSLLPPCPFCGKLLRHPLAQQCLECRTDWHGKTPPDKRW